MIDPTQALVRAIVTEKSMRLRDEHNQYLFEVKSDLNKINIKKVVEEAFKVKVTKVRVLSVAGKERRMGWFSGRQPDWKKAIVTLKKGTKIEGLEGGG
jgi:large subunit ribosomal protein L23